MALRQIMTPLDLTVHLGTPGCPVSYREMVQQEYESPDGLVRELVGEPSIVGGEYRGEAVAPILGAALVAAQAQAAASEARAATAEAALATARADIEAALAELATLRAAAAADSVGPA